MKILIFTICIIFNLNVIAASLNIYVWGGEIPSSLIRQFEDKTRIHVNLSTYDNNETMYAKLKASRQNIYDVILPSGYFVERMQKQGMLERIDHNLLSNIKNIDPKFINNDFDKGSHYSIPIIWGITGIFYNHDRFATRPTSWNDLWSLTKRKQLMLLDDAREIFAIGLMSLGFDPNDANPKHIKKAYEHLIKLVPNIKLFASDNIQSIMIDEDALMGVSWNGDAFKAHLENKAIDFIFPQDGFVMWVDCLAIPKNPPHLKQALQFIDFILQAQSSVQIQLKEGHAITNVKAKALLPSFLRDNPIIYPSKNIMQRAKFQRDVGDKALTLYNKYWEQLKLFL